MESLWFNKAAAAEDLLGDPPSFRNRTPLLKMLPWWSECRNPIPDRILTAKDSSRGKLEVNSGKLKCCGLEFAPLAWWHRAALLGDTPGKHSSSTKPWETNSSQTPEICCGTLLRSPVGLWNAHQGQDRGLRASTAVSSPAKTFN